MDKHCNDNGHTVQELGGHVARTKTTILEYIERFPGNQNQLEQLIQNIRDMKSKVQDHKQEVDTAIRKAFTQVRRLIDQREKALLDENDAIAVSKETRLSIQEEDAQHLLESIIQCHSLSSIATSEYSDVQLLSIAHTLDSRAASLHQQFTSTPVDVCVTPHVSVDVDTDALADVVAGFGSVADLSASNSTAMVPRQRLGIGAKMKVRVVTRDGKGKELKDGGARVRVRLSSNEEIGSLATDNSDGTYLSSVVPQQLGQHQLSITVNSQHIQNSPFTLDIVPQRDYTKFGNPVQTITGINRPRYIAFSDNGDMFVTSATDHCIHVYDKNGKKKATIGSEGRGEVQFERPYGIDINGEVVYVAEYGGHRIHKLTTGGEFIGTFGEEGSGAGQFNCPYDVKISPDGRVYVADRVNNRVQVFNPDWTASHVIEGRVSGDGKFREPTGLAFDLTGDVHVTAYCSSSVTVFTPNGQFVRQYDNTHISGPEGVAIDPSGYSSVTNFKTSTLSVYDPSGRFIHSVEGFDRPFGVSVSPEGSVWVADTHNNRLLKY